MRQRNLLTLMVMGCMTVPSVMQAQTMTEWQNPGINAVNRLPMHIAFRIWDHR